MPISESMVQDIVQEAGRNSSVRDDADAGHRCGRASGDGNEAGNG